MTHADRSAAGRDDAHAEVASTLWRERELLERLLFALICQQLVLSSGGVRWLTPADKLVQDAVAALADCELHRAIATHQLSQALGLPGDVTLDTLVGAADVPWDTLLGDHRDELRRLVAEIGLATAENRRLLQAGADLARETLARVGSATASYPGAAATEPSGAVLFDRQV